MDERVKILINADNDIILLSVYVFSSMLVVVTFNFLTGLCLSNISAIDSTVQTVDRYSDSLTNAPDIILFLFILIFLLHASFIFCYVHKIFNQPKFRISFKKVFSKEIIK